MENKKRLQGILGGIVYLVVMFSLHKFAPIGISIHFLGWVQILMAFGAIVLVYGFFKTEPTVWTRTSERGAPFQKFPEPLPPFVQGMALALGIATVIFIIYLAIPKKDFF